MTVACVYGLALLGELAHIRRPEVLGRSEKRLRLEMEPDAVLGRGTP